MPAAPTCCSSAAPCCRWGWVAAIARCVARCTPAPFPRASTAALPCPFLCPPRLWQVLRELGISEQQLQENVVEVWNKIDQLPPATSTQQHQQPADEQQGQLAAATNDAAAARPEGQQHAAPPEAGGAGVQHPSAAEQAAEGGEEHSGPPGGLHAAAGAGLLPPAVVALLQSSKAAAVNRPTAVATSVLHHQGLEAVLAAVESKVSAALRVCAAPRGYARCCRHAAWSSQPLPYPCLLQLEALLAREQRSRRGAKRAAAGWQQGGGRGGP